MPNRNQTQDSGRSNRSGRGFASMDEDKQREIASKGGRAAHRSGNAHEFDTEEAREAGRRGGLARSESRTASRSGELNGGQSVTYMQDLDEEPGISSMQDRDEMTGSSRARGRPDGSRGDGEAREQTDTIHRHSGTQVRGRDVGDEPSTRMPGRNDGRSGRKGEGSMRTSDKKRTDANDTNTSSGRGKHH